MQSSDRRKQTIKKIVRDCKRCNNGTVIRFEKVGPGYVATCLKCNIERAEGETMKELIKNWNKKQVGAKCI